MMVSSDRPTTLLPFSLNSTGIVAACAVLLRSMCRLLPSRDLVREVLHYGKHGVGRRLPQPAYGCVHHRRGKFLEQRLGPRLLSDEPERLRGTHAAGRALAARFLGEESRQVARGGRGAGRCGEVSDVRRADATAVL